jgi:HK97 family phage prohead protease
MSNAGGAEAMTESAEISAFRAAFGVLGEQERRAFRTERASVKESGAGDGRMKVKGYASVFDSPSLEMTSPLGNFIEFIDPHAFDDVLARKPDVLFTIDHDTRLVLARTWAGTLELSTNAHGLMYFARVSDVSYARDLKTLMTDGVITQSSFLFTIAPGGETWDVADNSETVTRTITKVGELYDVCCCAAGCYSQTSSGLARSIALEYARERGYLHADDQTAAKRRAELQLELRKRRLL